MKKSILIALSLVISSVSFALKVKDQKVILEKLDDYKECQTKDYEGNICDTALRAWVESHPADAFKAGKMTRASMNAWGAIYFFNKAFDKKKEDCTDKDVWLAIESAAGLPERNKEPIDGMKSIAFKKCFAELKSDLVSTASKGGYEAKNLCPELKTKKAAPAECEQK